MYIFPIYLTLINFVISILCGKFIGIKGACYLTSFFIGVSFFFLFLFITR